MSRLDQLIQGAGNLSSYETVSESNSVSSNLISNLGSGFKITPGFAILVVAMLIIGLMSLRQNKKQNQSKIDWMRE